MNSSVKKWTVLTGYLLMANTLFAFNRQDSLRGSNGNGRNWWDVLQYKLHWQIDTVTRSISGTNSIRFSIAGTVRDSIQIDLQEPMLLDSAVLNGDRKLSLTREGNVYWLTHPFPGPGYQEYNVLDLFFHGTPRQAPRPPWDGGFIWARDSMGQGWISVACQGLGASSWWPCKDYQGDEPDYGMEMSLSPFSTGQVMNGRPHIDSVFVEKSGYYNDLYRNAVWKVQNPINTYDVSFYIGDYISWTDTFNGIKGKLDLAFYPLRYNEGKAREQFKQVKQMLRAFEHWFGPYPFYEDGYKIVEAPFLGMEHQSAIAYGNLYQQGYRGKDRSGTGIGLLFDFIIVHESGHEWFGNSVTAADIADNWIHEGFTTYSETLFTEYWYGKEKAFEYCRGEWKNILNDRPVIGHYGVHDGGSGDKYDKGSALVHTIRLLMNDDQRFRGLLHAICDTFRHKQISSAQLETFICRFSGLKLQPVFNQYLRSTDIPELEYHIENNRIQFRFNQVSPGFSLPVPVQINGSRNTIYPNEVWQSIAIKKAITSFSVPPTFLIRIKERVKE